MRTLNYTPTHERRNSFRDATYGVERPGPWNTISPTQT